MGKENRIDKLLRHKRSVLSVYFTAGFTTADDTLRIAYDLQRAGADMLEIGIPFSDPVADGPVIQASSRAALEHGMTLSALFSQLGDLRKKVKTPTLLMGYFNPILAFGVERFCQHCRMVDIDGVIIPDLPLEEYLRSYQRPIADEGLHNILMISPNTPPERVSLIDSHAGGFIYMVSSHAVTGSAEIDANTQRSYYERIERMGLHTPLVVGFGIGDRASFDLACKYAHGAIVGSAFIRQLQRDASAEAIRQFVEGFKA